LAAEAEEARAALVEARRAGAGRGPGGGRDQPPKRGRCGCRTSPKRPTPTPTACGPRKTLEADILRLKRQRDALGAVNLRAEEDARELRIEHDRLVEEKRDLETAIARLREGIAGLNREGRARLLTAFETVNGQLPRSLRIFSAAAPPSLSWSKATIRWKPGSRSWRSRPARSWRRCRLLSGGEQTLTALALIFAVFLANPAPICVLDEVDAPLDDANVGRFCDLLDEMTRRTETRFLIITHNAITWHGWIGCSASPWPSRGSASWSASICAGPRRWLPDRKAQCV
jgi:chromosome segregation protein